MVHARQHSHAHTLVLDIGKSNAKLVLLDAQGQVRGRRQQANRSVDVAANGPAPGYRALGVDALAAWLRRDIPALAAQAMAEDGATISRIAITTHGAAFCALGEQGRDESMGDGAGLGLRLGLGLVMPPLDYEWNGYGALADEVHAEFDAFAHNGTPVLPQGLNAGLQLAWVHRRQPALAARIRHWLPYPQYWAWWFTGLLASEVTSLGCHTGLWAPGLGRFSDWVRAQGLATLFPPLQPAEAVLGRIKPSLAHDLDLSPTTEVSVGVHDSNACLARYLHAAPQAVVVSTGTWCVLMAPGAPLHGLQASRDELVNVAADGRPVPTARFMGGREFAALCDGADPALATEAALQEVLQQDWMAHPAFAASGGPWSGQPGWISQHGKPCADGIAAVPAALRPALAALYCAEVTAYLINNISPAAAHPPAPVVLEGPLADNPAWRAALVSLLAPRSVQIASDDLEGTARGAWLLTQGSLKPNPSPDSTTSSDPGLNDDPQEGAGASKSHLQLRTIPPSLSAVYAAALHAHAKAWRAALPAPASAPR